MTLRKRWERGQVVQTLGFDDVPFNKEVDQVVHVAGMFCQNTRLEGMVWGAVTRDGTDATEVIIDLVTRSKFYPSVDLILLDGLTFAGMNVVDLPALAERTERPCASIMRRPPDFAAIEHVLTRFDDGPMRRARMAAAGPVHERGGFCFQVMGAEPDVLAPLLQRLTDRGKVPEPLRLAHLVGAAVKLGQSGKRA
ncbi:MAG: DUF99 family protein [Myxococcota bacterium]